MRILFIAAGAAALSAMPAAAQDSADALADAFVAAVVAEDAEALAALYTEDADSYGPDGGVTHGRAEIAASWSPLFEAYDDFEVTLDKKGERAFGKDSHAAWGLWAMTMTPVAGGERETMTGRYSDVSIKTRDGWRYIVDHASPLAAEPENAAAEQ